MCLQTLLVGTEWADVLYTSDTICLVTLVFDMLCLSGSVDVLYPTPTV